ncbi:hypothetical protein [Methylobacterium sp. JK268]
MLRILRSATLVAAVPLAACVPSAAPDWLVLAARPDIPVQGPRYAGVTAGVKRFDVVDPKDWRELNRAVAPKPGQGSMGGMPGMEGMDHSRMPGMGKPQDGPGSGGMDHSNMPGMNMPGMGGKRDTGGR